MYVSSSTWFWGTLVSLYLCDKVRANRYSRKVL